MQVKVNQSSPTSPKTNPPQNQTNPQLNQSQAQKNPNPSQINDIQKIIEDVLTKYLTQQQNLNPQQQKQQNATDGEYIIKSDMKASYIALRVEQILWQRKKIVLSAVGFAIPVELDVVLLVQKDLRKQQKEINIEKMELFEHEFISNGKKKIVSGLKISISI